MTHNAGDIFWYTRKLLEEKFKPGTKVQASEVFDYLIPVLRLSIDAEDIVRFILEALNRCGYLTYEQNIWMTMPDYVIFHDHSRV